MRFARLQTSLVLGGIVVATFALFFLAPWVAATSSSKPCTRYGDTQPRQLTKKHARNAIICLINKERNSRGRGDLDRDSRLQTAARKHSDVMADKRCFSHECPGERDLLGRLQAVGYIVGGLSRWAYGEDIAWGERGLGTPRQTVKGWMNSPAHRANILSGTFRDIGAGFARSGDRGYYTADFGLRVG